MIWGIGAFQCDDAADWGHELVAADSLDLIVETLSFVRDHQDEELEIPESQRAIAAAETLAALLDGQGENLPEEVQRWIQGHNEFDAVVHIPVAVEALEAIEHNSERNDAWRETADYTDWQESIARLVLRLRSLQGEGDAS
jgi:hypothetical protein